MTGTALDQETMETWLDVIPLLEVGRALVSRRRTCLPALRSLYHLTAQNICRSRWPCDRRPLYVLERRWIVHHRSSTGFGAQIRMGLHSMPRGSCTDGNVRKNQPALTRASEKVLVTSER